MYNDSPIKYNREDKLNRKEFADSIAESIINLPKRSDSIVIGLMGGWGTGKSSLLNLTENRLKGYVKILRFNPWNYYSQQMLFSSFFDELIGCLNLNDKISALFQKYKYKIIGSGISLSSSVVPELNLINNFVPDSEYKTLTRIKDKLEELFRKQPKTVIIIDDIDRMNPTEVKQIFQLVKSLADFPNLIYVLAFDKDYVNYALKDWNMDTNDYSHSEDFIDKIIQVPLTIPKFSEGDKLDIFKSKFNKVINNHDVDVTDFNLHELYLMWLSPFFKNIRDINRYCNALDFYLYSMDTKIWIHDFSLVTLLQIFANDIYDEIKNNKDLLTGDFEAFKGNYDLINMHKGNLDNFLEIIFNKHDMNNKIKVKQILSNLFPKVNYVINQSYTPSSKISIKRKHCGIMEKEYFDLYFTFDSINNLSKSRIETVIHAANKNIENLKENILSIKNIGLFDSLINQLTYHINSFEENGIKNLIKVFNDNYEDLFVEEQFTSNPSISDAINLIYYFINEEHINGENLFDTVNECENNYFKAQLIYELDHIDLLNEKLMAKLIEDMSLYLSEYFEKTEISKINHVRTNIAFWRYFSGFEVTNEYLNNLNDEDLINFVSEYINTNIIKEQKEIEYDNLKYVVELKFIKKRFEKIKKSKINDDEKMRVINLFLENYPKSN